MRCISSEMCLTNMYTLYLYRVTQYSGSGMIALEQRLRITLACHNYMTCGCLLHNAENTVT